MVPPGIPGRSDRDFLPVHDPAAARSLLAEAGYPGGAGFPDDDADDRRRRASMRPSSTRSSASSASRSAPRRWATATSTGSTTDPPAMWSLGWVADYPGRNDFLGVLLGTRRVEQLRPLELADVRRGDRRGRARRPIRPPRRPPTTGPRRSSATRSRSCRSSTARAGRCRGRAARRGPERARDRPDGGAGVGATDAPRLAGGRRGRRGLLASAWRPGRARARRWATFGTPDGRVDLRHRRRVQPAGHRRRASRRGSSCC